MGSKQATPFKRILVTGATGFLGSHIVPALTAQIAGDVTPVHRSDFDLRDASQVDRMLDATRPDAVIHLAAKVGGIIANRNYPAEFFYDNLVMNTLVFDSCHRHGVQKLVTFIGGCSYPATAQSPINEDQMWEGYPQSESAPYSTAKKMMLVQSQAYRRQYGFNSVVLIPGNVYGEHDNFNEEYAHVIPALIRRFIEARERRMKTIACYGSGRPTRDFVYAGDVALLVPWFLIHYDSSQPINLSSGLRISIRELSESIQRITGFEGTIEWDTTKPDGQIDKIFDIQRLRQMGLSCPTPLETGIRKTVDWFLKARVSHQVRF